MLKSFISIVLLARIGVSVGQTTTSSQCRVNGYTMQSDGQCYRAYSPTVTNSFASSLCTPDGAYLVSIHNPTENTIALNMALSMSRTIWVGMKCMATNACYWDDGTAYNYANFAAGFPNMAYGNCTSMILGTGDRGQWQSTDCDFSANSVVCRLYDGVVQTTMPIFITTPSASQSPYTCPPNNQYYDSGIIQSPGYPYPYGPDLACLYYLTVASNAIVELQFQAFAIEPDYDWVYIYNGRTANPAQLIAQLTGRNLDLNAIYRSTTNQMLVSFFTNNRITAADYGWKATFRASLASTVNPTIATAATTPWTDPNTCPSNNFYDNFGTVDYLQVSSPGYPYDYGNNLNCTYQLRVYTGYRVQLQFLAFSTEQCCDIVYLYDGDTINAPLIVRLSGQPPLARYYYSTSNKMLIQFVTDPSTTLSGWSAFFSYGDGTSMFPPPTVPPTAIVDERCPAGWIHDSVYPYCYTLVTFQQTFSQAQSACMTLGGQMVSVRNRAQNDFIANAVINAQMGSGVTNIYIGLHRVSQQWGWSDGTVLNYLQWLEGEPSAAGDCAVIQPWSPTGWIAINCQTPLGYLCYKNSLEGSKGEGKMIPIEK